MNRELIKNKFGGLCAYTGKPLGEDWQIDHIKPKRIGGTDDIDNLLPAIKIINHYKRAKDLESFRKYMLSFHERLARLPKNPMTQKSANRVEYLSDIAMLFGITKQKPFNGKFYFETLKNKKCP